MAYVKQLVLRHFRNYTEQDLVLKPGLTVITGQNASGKTSLLEAIAFLSFGKSPRTHIDKALLMHDAPFGLVKCEAQLQNQSQIQLACQFQKPQADIVKTQFKFNDKVVRSRSLLVGKIPCVAFFNADLLMLRGSPSDRRSQLDMALTQMSPDYFEWLKQFEKLRIQKASILKNYFESPQPELLSVLNQQLIPVAAKITHRRLQYLAQLGQILQETYHQLAEKDPEILKISYQSKLQELPFEFVDEDQQNIEAIESLFKQKIEQRNQDEIRRGQVLIGPHRDDLVFELSGESATEFASQGQQRTIVLAFKSVVYQLLSQQLGQEKPVLLLDDVMAELDPNRQKALLSLFEGDAQVLLTTTHLDGHLPFVQAFKHHNENQPIEHLEVENGKIRSQSKAFSLSV